MSKRKICIVTGSRSEWVKLQSIAKEIAIHPNLQLQLVVIGQHNLDDFGMTAKEIEKEFAIDYKIYTTVDGSNPSAMVKSTSIVMNDLALIFQKLKPDIVVIYGDRFDMLGVAIASSFMNIPIAHIECGEESNSIDNSIRHAITKLGHIFLPNTFLSSRKVIAMGEDSKKVFNVGSLATEQIKKIKIEERLIKEEYAIVAFHPDTTEYQKSYDQMTMILESMKEIGIKGLLFFPNSDPGSSEIVRAIRNFEAKEKNTIIEKYKNISLDKFINLLYHCMIMIGNSSSGIRESHIYNIPTINIGKRQNNREKDRNVFDVGFDKEKIKSLIVKHYGRRIVVNNSVYGNSDGVARKIVTILSEISLDNILSKKLCYGIE